MRSCGILLPVAALPSHFGIGDFGPEAYDFVDKLAACGVTQWQILPLNPLGYGNSPYQPFSSFAGDEIYISPELLIRDSLLGKEHLKDAFQSDRIDYYLVRKNKEKILREAYSRFSGDSEYAAFKAQDWVYKYGVFFTLKKKNGYRCWNEWNEKDKHWIDTPFCFSEKETDEIEYVIFCQYLFYRQWMSLKNYANEKGISIIGDIPFYVGIDSLDVWMNKACFKLDREGRPYTIAGVPPDFFSKTGQRWGNPIYDWDYLEKTGFVFLIERLAYSSRLFDVIRIDHFRAFDTYYEIPSSCPTAEIGKWVEAPGYKFFDALFSSYPEIKIVVEDLGDLREEVHQLRDHYGFKGMKILQFAYDPNESNNRFADKENMLIYTGTHDNEPVLGWFSKLDSDTQAQVLDLLRREGYQGDDVNWLFIARALSSVAEIAILQMQDVLGLGTEARINVPGVLGSPNWEWMMPSFELFDAKAEKLKNLIIRTKR